uniref:Uncharacterized protein n=1 Tax=Solanum tuberosum TaxID=4113 RepID=M1DG39_SOLTU
MGYVVSAIDRAYEIVHIIFSRRMKCFEYEKMDKLSMSMIVMRPDWLIVKSEEWEDMVLDYDSLSMFRRVFTFVGGCLVVNRMDRFMLSWQNRILVWVGRFRDNGFDVVLGWYKVFGSSTSVILLLERYREAIVARGPSSSVVGVAYNYGSYFSVLVASLEVLYAWMGRSSVGYLIISICGLDKRDYSKMGARWICIRLV